MSKNQKNNHYVYRLDDPITGEFYIGSRSCKCKITDDNYMGSYKRWKPEDKTRLIKTILKTDFLNKNDAYDFEAGVIGENINNKLNRNYHIPANGFRMDGTHHTNETKRKISEASTGRICSDETRKKLSISSTGRYHTNEAKKKMSESRKGMYLGMSYEERHGVELADELKEKRRKQLTEHNPARLKHVKEQLIERNVKNNPMNSIESRMKISEANKGRIPWNKGIKWKTKKNR
jgi:hypothetical protein